MNEVWIVEFGSVYEGLEVVSVWQTEEEAKAEAERLETPGNCFQSDMAKVVRFTVGAPHETPN
jgi:hypothetical protein